MIIRILCLSLASLVCGIYLQSRWIEWMQRFKLGQAIKEYGPQAHMKKSGTPSMGGVVALILAPLFAGVAVFYDAATLHGMLKIWIYPVVAAMIGFLDDALKLRTKSSEGLRSIQKIVIQLLVTVPWAYFMSYKGLYITPTISIAPLYGAALLVFLGVGIQNAVNVTDGLDGLAGGAVAISLIAVIFLFFQGEAPDIIFSASIGLALVIAFLWHNSNPAKLFMGDVGAHFWGGLLISLCVFSKSLIFIFAVAFIFGIEIITVAIQIYAIRRFKKKVFLMSPIHHHFELMGWKETCIVSRFWIAHIIGMVVVVIIILSLGGGA